MDGIISKIRLYGFKKFIRFGVKEMRLIFINRIFMKSYSQSSEDLIIDDITGHKKIGFYIDIGAFDPVRFSNTLRFYNRGWCGINIEPNSYQWKKFLGTRNRDLNLNIGISSKRGILMFYQMDPPTLSTFSKEQVIKYINEGFRLVNKKKVKVLTLAEIFSMYSRNTKIDFMSLDVEGFEIEVLKSNDWKKFRPKCICIEKEKPGDNFKLNNNPIFRFLFKQGYSCKKITSSNAIFLDINE